MSKPHPRCLAFVLCLPLWAGGSSAFAQLAAAPAKPLPSNSPAAKHPPLRFDVSEGLIKLDVVVTDAAGKPVTGLGLNDFTLFENTQPAHILSFHAFDGVSAKPEPPSEVILVIDTLDLRDGLASYEEREVRRFLRQNHGHLAQPVSVYGLSRVGLWSVAGPSQDGNALAAELDRNRPTVLMPRTLIRRGESADSLRLDDPPGLTALKTIEKIAIAESRKPGRKLLLWVGPGWGLGTGVPFFSNLDREQLFSAIHWLSTLMRQARIALYSFSVGESAPNFKALLYRESLAGVRTIQQASVASLDRRVLAVQSGGTVLEPTNDLPSDIMNTGLSDRQPVYDLAGQMDRSVAVADAFYELSFNPSYTEEFDQYRDLEVQVDKPGLTARTSTGYYDQPYFYDQPHQPARQVTVAQLEQELKAARGERDAALASQLSQLELSEPLSESTLSSWKPLVKGPKSWNTLVALADSSAFLSPPSAELTSIAPPDLGAQKLMIAQVADYLDQTIPTLPNVFAARSTVRYQETPEHYDNARSRRINFQPLHWVDTSKATVLYRGGNEIVETGPEKLVSLHGEEEGLATKGTFGPILAAVSDAIAVPGGMTWSRWEQDASGLRAVFRFVTPEGKSRFEVNYCCLPDGDGNIAIRTYNGYHGEIAIDPGTGVIFRLVLEADLKPGLPLKRSAVLVRYGPVEIGAKTYIVPIQSVSVSRSRTVLELWEGNASFRVFGPFATFLNDVTFDHYHAFRSESTILTGFTPAPARR